VPAARRRGTFTSRALILLLVLAVLGVSYASSIRAWLNQRSEQNTLSAQLSADRQSIAELTNQTKRWSDPAYIEMQARLRFGWVMPGERSYRVIGRDGRVLPAGNDELSGVNPGITADTPPWWDRTVRSLSRADAVPAPPKPRHHARVPAKIIRPDTRTGQ
jgi:cell division protein FtsB